jgi:D-alanine-D-alanine ligase
MKIGIFLGGSSREREISFAGGRTVYDNLDKALFTPVPIFVDSFGHFILLDWEWLYKGTIRDFFPPDKCIPDEDKVFQVYLEHIDSADGALTAKAGKSIGKRISVDDLSATIDFAFLTLHGMMGEDGTLQGLLEWMRIPYSGTGILGSAIGIHKLTQKNLMPGLNFPVTPYVAIYKHEIQDRLPTIAAYIRSHIGYPCVVKSPVQGSSIGLSILENEDALPAALAHALMRKKIEASDWLHLSDLQKHQWIRHYIDIREQPGLPARVVEMPEQYIQGPTELLSFLNQALLTLPSITLEADDVGEIVLVEKFLDGKEFSVIVIQDEQGNPLALPPTGIIKNQTLYDYRSKYLPGMARKVTPIDLPDDAIRKIMREAERLMFELGFSVYARIDGYYMPDSTIYLSDPNTTSGMLPGSFFFHQAAEAGLDPSAFITFIIHSSLKARIKEMNTRNKATDLLAKLQNALKKRNQQEDTRTPVGVVLGGYSSERHISVESGRNIYEKLSSSGVYAPVPLFLMQIQDVPPALRALTETTPGCGYCLWQIPIHLLLKDNADDIRDKILQLYQDPHVHPVVQELRHRTQAFMEPFRMNASFANPSPVLASELQHRFGFIFIALHGRPGEDGHLQTLLEQLQVPYNGSGIPSSRITIDKHATISRLKAYGFKGATQKMIHRSEWQRDPGVIIQKLESEFSYPIIAKPSDDGCSSAVKKIRNADMLEAYAQIAFRDTIEIPSTPAAILSLHPTEMFPAKEYFLVESLQAKDEDDVHFLEVTVGLLTRRDKDGELKYEIFEPSETLAGADILSLEEKFLAGEGQNITPARFHALPTESAKISRKVRKIIREAAILLGIEGYARIDAFVRLKADGRVEVEFIEVNSLPGMTPATCIFHQSAIAGLTPFHFIDKIIAHGMERYSSNN